MKILVSVKDRRIEWVKYWTTHTVTGARPKGSSTSQEDLQTSDTGEALLVEIIDDNNIGTSLTDDMEFPPLQRRNSGRTPRGEKINELIEQLHTHFDDNGTKLYNKKPPLQER